MRFKWWVGYRIPGDSRITLVRFQSDQWVYGKGWKVSISLHRKLFYWKQQYKEIYCTLMGINIHWRST